MIYPVEREGNRVGTAIVERIGLYAQIRCSCNTLGNGYHRLYMLFDDKELDLGILIRKESMFVTTRKIPYKSFGSGRGGFRIITIESVQKKLVELVADQPFSYVCGLRKGTLKHENDKVYLAVSSQDNLMDRLHLDRENYQMSE